MAKLSDYDRVTNVLYPFSDLQKIDPSVLKNAAERGEKVHEFCTAIMNDLGVVEINPNYEGYLKSFEIWMQGKEFCPRPDRFFCDKYKITGEIDGLYSNETGMTLFDIKTPAKESKSWLLQGSAYSYLAKQAGLKITKIEFVRLCKNGSPAVSYIYEENMDMFLKCLDIYRYFFSKKSEESYLDYL
jgi:hypothetical protein